MAVIAEGLVLDIDSADLATLTDVERDPHGNVRIAEVNIGEVLKTSVQRRLKEFKLETTIAAKNIGYELRCADPIPFDMEYTRDLGYCAAKYLLSGGTATMVSMQGAILWRFRFPRSSTPGRVGRTSAWSTFIPRGTPSPVVT